MFDFQFMEIRSHISQATSSIGLLEQNRIQFRQIFVGIQEIQADKGADI
jgi:hypothetical protein